MNLSDTAKILAMIQIYDNRTVDETSIRAWHQLLAEYTFQDCQQAVLDHFKNSTKWVMPAHIIQSVKETQYMRTLKFGGFMPLNPADEYDETGNITADYQQKTQALHEAARNGKISPQQYADYQAERITLEQLHNTKAITE